MANGASTASRTDISSSSTGLQMSAAAFSSENHGRNRRLNTYYTSLHLSYKTSLIPSPSLAPSQLMQTAAVYTCTVHFILVSHLFLSHLLHVLFFFIIHVHLMTCAVQLCWISKVPLHYIVTYANSKHKITCLTTHKCYSNTTEQMVWHLFRWILCCNRIIPSQHLTSMVSFNYCNTLHMLLRKTAAHWRVSPTKRHTFESDKTC